MAKATLVSAVFNLCFSSSWEHNLVLHQPRFNVLCAQQVVEYHGKFCSVNARLVLKNILLHLILERALLYFSGFDSVQNILLHRKAFFFGYFPCCQVSAVRLVVPVI